MEKWVQLEEQGAHLHYEIKVNGRSINPYDFISVGRDLLSSSIIKNNKSWHLNCCFIFMRKILLIIIYLFSFDLFASENLSNCNYLTEKYGKIYKYLKNC